jgi:Methylase involved in ubiquinone/menaquinone biosynthesis
VTLSAFVKHGRAFTRTVARGGESASALGASCESIVEWPNVLGHSDDELDRLRAQARLIDPISRRFLLEAGIGTGMRVLDVGSGAGDVAFVAVELVGATGEVVGVDRSTAALEVARARAGERSLANVSFLEGDPTSTALGRPFDAAIGRYVLSFRPTRRDAPEDCKTCTARRRGRLSRA